MVGHQHVRVVHDGGYGVSEGWWEVAGYFVLFCIIFGMGWARGYAKGLEDGEQ